MLFDIQPVQMRSGLTPDFPEVGKHSLNCFTFTLMHQFLQRGVKAAIKVGRLSTLSVSNLIKEGRNTINLSRKAVSHDIQLSLAGRSQGYGQFR